MIHGCGNEGVVGGVFCVAWDCECVDGFVFVSEVFLLCDQLVVGMRVLVVICVLVALH